MEMDLMKPTDPAHEHCLAAFDTLFEGEQIVRSGKENGLYRAVYQTHLFYPPTYTEDAERLARQTSTTSNHALFSDGSLERLGKVSAATPIVLVLP